MKNAWYHTNFMLLWGIYAVWEICYFVVGIFAEVFKISENMWQPIDGALDTFNTWLFFIVLIYSIFARNYPVFIRKIRDDYPKITIYLECLGAYTIISFILMAWLMIGWLACYHFDLAEALKHIAVWHVYALIGCNIAGYFAAIGYATYQNYYITDK